MRRRPRTNDDWDALQAALAPVARCAAQIATGTTDQASSSLGIMERLLRDTLREDFTAWAKTLTLPGAFVYVTLQALAPDENPGRSPMLSPADADEWAAMLGLPDAILSVVAGLTLDEASSRQSQGTLDRDALHALAGLRGYLLPDPLPIMD